MKPDTIDNVRKNQKIPKEMTLYFLKRKMATLINDKRTRKLTIVRISKKPAETGKS